jgi:hypothetical protein
MDPELCEVAQEIAAVFERLHVPYLVGGSLASSLHGEYRTSVDVDVVAEIRPQDVDALVPALQIGFFVDAEHVLEAVHGHRSFNAVHRRRFVKVDVFVGAGEGFQREEMLRARRMSLSGPSGPTVRVASAEDTVLQKLAWYRMGEEVSERQWRDVVGVLKTGGASLDRAYLDRWARELDLTSLLERAARDAGIAGPDPRR